MLRYDAELGQSGQAFAASRLRCAAVVSAECTALAVVRLRERKMEIIGTARERRKPSSLENSFGR
jgi:hypothetical protein